MLFKKRIDNTKTFKVIAIASFFSVASSESYGVDSIKLYDNKKAFDVSFSEKVDNEDLYFIEDIIKDSFDMSKSTATRIPIIKKDDIKIDCNHSSILASMQIIAKDQKGLFAYVAKIFDDFNIEIESAKIHTLNGYARDLILIEKNGNFCSNQEEILNLMTILG